MGKDHTLFAVVTGTVKFTHDPVKKRSWVHVVDLEQALEEEKRRGRVFDLVDVSSTAAEATA